MIRAASQGGASAVAAIAAIAAVAVERAARVIPPRDEVQVLLHGARHCHHLLQQRSEARVDRLPAATFPSLTSSHASCSASADAFSSSLQM